MVLGQFQYGILETLPGISLPSEELEEFVAKVFRDAETLFGEMALKTMNTECTESILKILFPLSERQKNEGLEPERWSRVKHILEDSSITPRKTRGTLWAVYNAITRDEDYRKSREASSEARLERVWFGSGHDLKIKALSVCRGQLRSVA